MASSQEAAFLPLREFKGDISLLDSQKVRLYCDLCLREETEPAGISTAQADRVEGF